MSGTEQLLSSLVTSNNNRVRRLEGPQPNPRPTETLQWVRRIEGEWHQIRGEWDAFVNSGGELPLIEQVIDEHQGNQGEWRIGLLVSKRRPVRPLADRFPATLGALRGIPGLRSALLSCFEESLVLPEHTGPNCGVLRYHLGVDCGEGAQLCIGDGRFDYADGKSILFDDTEPHSAVNSGDRRRVTLFCEIDRPLPPVPGALNRLVQWLISLDPRYRVAPKRAAVLHELLNN